MRIFITGGEGMLGRTLQRHLPPHELGIGDLPEFDITDLAAVDSAFRAFEPELVIHCAAMTDVDGCESDPDAAFRINALGSAIVAACAHRAGARLIALSTDYVFDGRLDRPYHEFDAPAPATVYGASKLAGERAVAAHCPDHTIVRTAWLYGENGPSFFHTMRRLGGESGGLLKVVDDQRGNPTSTDALAALIGALIETPVPGVVHASCEGEATWCEFAVTIFRLCGLKRRIFPCTTGDFPRPASRPANSSLENRVLRMAGLDPMPQWYDALAAYIASIN